MYRIALAAAFSALGLSFAAAADLPLKARAPIAIGPSWTGFYAGLNGGYGWGNASSTAVAADPASQQLINFLPPGSFGTSFRQEGAIVGGQAGYNWQFASQWLVGIETDIQRAYLDGRDQHQVIVPGVQLTDAGLFESGERHLKWFGTVRGRLGFLATPSLLLYGTGGVAYGQAQSEGSIVVAAFRNNTTATVQSIVNGTVLFCRAQGPQVTTCYSGSGSETSVGWTAGLGAEWKFAPNWSAKLEYLRVELPGNTARLVSPPPSTANVATDFRFNQQGYDLVRVGLNYQFGGPALR